MRTCFWTLLTGDGVSNLAEDWLACLPEKTIATGFLFGNTGLRIVSIGHKTEPFRWHSV